MHAKSDAAATIASRTRRMGKTFDETVRITRMSSAASSRRIQGRDEAGDCADRSGGT